MLVLLSTDCVWCRLDFCAVFTDAMYNDGFTQYKIRTLPAQFINYYKSVGCFSFTKFVFCSFLELFHSFYTSHLVRVLVCKKLTIFVLPCIDSRLRDGLDCQKRSEE